MQIILNRLWSILDLSHWHTESHKNERKKMKCSVFQRWTKENYKKKKILFTQKFESSTAPDNWIAVKQKRTMRKQFSSFVQFSFSSFLFFFLFSSKIFHFKWKHFTLLWSCCVIMRLPLYVDAPTYHCISICLY